MPVLILWAYALGSLLFFALALDRWERGGAPALVAAFGLTALWALAVAGIGSDDVTASVTEGARDLAWLGVILATARRGRIVGPVRATVFAVAAFLPIALIVVAVARAIDPTGHAPALHFTLWSLRLLIALAGLILLLGTVHAGGSRRLAAATAMLWSVDLFVFAPGPLSGWSPMLVLARGVGAVAVGAAFALAAAPRTGRRFDLSRALRLRVVAGVALLAYLAAIVAASGAAAAFAGAQARVVQTAIVIGAAAALGALASTPWLRAWTRVVIEKNLFGHRYDYRSAWARFAGTLGRPGEDGPLAARIVQATADLVDAPAGLLLTADDDGLRVSAVWRWDGRTGDGIGDPLAHHMLSTGRVIELDRVRERTAPKVELDGVPDWITADPRGWALVPLAHAGGLVGAILLARPPVSRPLDWEDFDLLRVAGAQAASYLAEHRAQAALADAERFDEFNRRFAFILHDIKNLVSQLALVARGAERHADNPSFRADMIVTLNESTERMTALLAKLQHEPLPHAGPPATVDACEVIARAIGSRRDRVRVVADGPVLALADAAGLTQAIGHLVQNAVEASPDGAPVTVTALVAAGRASIEVADRGCGMSPAFVRDQLFRPFGSTKPGGFGLGAFEARQLVRAMGGTLEVDSLEGEGTRFRVTLPQAPAQEHPLLERAA